MTQLYLYRISQTTNNGYDTYDSAVVCAASAEDARRLCPGGDVWVAGCAADEQPFGWQHSWADTPDAVTVELIGTAADAVAAGVVCASFNAG